MTRPELGSEWFELANAIARGEHYICVGRAIRGFGLNRVELGERVAVALYMADYEMALAYH